MTRAAYRFETFCLSALLALVPFEPRRPALHAFGVSFTLLEIAAALAGIALLGSVRERLGGLLRRPPWPLALLAVYAAAHVTSATLAEEHRDLALKFALRMVVMAGLAFVIAALPTAALGTGLAALAASATVVAVLALLEGREARLLDPFLALFRETPFNVGGFRRATAGSEYANLAAAMLLYGLLAGVGLATRLATPVRAIVPWAALFTAGLLFTYSRGALAAATVGLVALLAALRRDRPRAAAPAAALAMVVVGSATFAYAGEAFRLRLETEGTTGWYGASYAPQERALVMAPGERRTLTVQVTNTGLKTWSVAEAFHLGYHWYQPTRRWRADGSRSVLPHDLAPGESVVLEPELRAPDPEGHYLLLWDMVHEHTTWFSEDGVQPGVVRVVVSSSGTPVAPPSEATAGATALRWRPGRGELWRLALGMWRDHPWLGVGPDNYRRLYGPRAGRPLWDQRVFANSTLLEAVATTGSLGGLALAGTLTAALVGAWCALAAAAPSSSERAVAAALLALAAGIAAHGLADYVLAFTGHYLVFAVVLGGIAGLSRAQGA